MKHRAALLALLLAGLIVTSAGASSESLQFVATGQVLSHSIRFHALWLVQQPADCPAAEPDLDDPNFDADLDAWFSDYCQPFREQAVDVVLRIYRFGGRQVYADDESGTGSPTRGGGVRFVVYQNQFARTCGVFRWRITAIDPYGGPSKLDAGLFRLDCKTHTLNPKPLG